MNKNELRAKPKFNEFVKEGNDVNFTTFTESPVVNLILKSEDGDIRIQYPAYDKDCIRYYSDTMNFMYENNVFAEIYDKYIQAFRSIENGEYTKEKLLCFISKEILSNITFDFYVTAMCSREVFIDRTNIDELPLKVLIISTKMKAIRPLLNHFNSYANNKEDREFLITRTSELICYGLNVPGYSNEVIEFVKDAFKKYSDKPRSEDEIAILQNKTVRQLLIKLPIDKNVLRYLDQRIIELMSKPITISARKKEIINLERYKNIAGFDKRVFASSPKESVNCIAMKTEDTCFVIKVPDYHTKSIAVIVAESLGYLQYNCDVLIKVYGEVLKAVNLNVTEEVFFKECKKAIFSSDVIDRVNDLCFINNTCPEKDFNFDLIRTSMLIQIASPLAMYYMQHNSIVRKLEQMNFIDKFLDKVIFEVDDNFNKVKEYVKNEYINASKAIPFPEHVKKRLIDFADDATYTVIDTLLVNYITNDAEEFIQVIIGKIISYKVLEREDD